jgi:predicted acylesterase/phospholipase RssA
MKDLSYQDKEKIPKDFSKIECVALEGGGILGIAYLPLIKAILSESRANRFAGTSAGAITAMLLAIELPYDKIEQIQKETPWYKFASYKFPALWRLLTRKGLHDLKFARAWIENILDMTRFGRNAKFKDLNHYLYVGATKYRLSKLIGADAEPFIFSKENTPNVKIVDAVLASMAVPIFFEYVKIGEEYFCDGGVAMNHPVSIFEDRLSYTVLGIRVDNSVEFLRFEEDENKGFGPSLFDIIFAIGKMLRRLANDRFIPDHLWKQIIRIDVGNQSALDFNILPNDINKLLEAGKVAEQKWRLK